jgi:penicillin G amidase
LGLLRTLGTVARSVGRLRPPDSVAVAGGRARITWSAQHVPTIDAPDEAGAWQALGHLHALDRLWQLDLLRSVGRGEVSRLLGDQPLDWRRSTIHHAGLRTPDLDFFLRTFGILRAARGSLDATSDRGRGLLQAYVRGVNDGLVATRRSLEHSLLEVDPRTWTALDTAVVGKVFAYNLNQAWQAKLAFRALSRQLGPEAAAALLPRSFPGSPRIARVLESSGARLSDTEQGLLAADEAARLFTGGLGAHLGSNAWVMGGSRTSTGKPVLCGDPHLEASAPAPFYLARLRGGDLDVAGATVPGAPGVVIGRTRRVAWSCTSAVPDDCDLYSLRLDTPLAPWGTGPLQAPAPAAGSPAGPGQGPHGELGAADPQARLPLECLSTTIEVRGGPSQQRVIRICEGAAVLSLTLGAELAWDRGEALAMRWGAVESPGRELDAVLALNHAADFQGFREALRGFHAPAQNFAYADTEGHVGNVLAGRFPIRRGGPALLPRALSDPEGDWVGWVPFDQLPCVLDPPEDLVAHANNEPVEGDYPHYLSALYSPPHRIRRIVERLGALSEATPQEVAAVQTDVRSLQGLEFVARFLEPRAEALVELRPDGERVLRVILDWDGECRPDSPGAAAFHVFHDEFLREVCERPMDAAYVSFREQWVQAETLLEDLLAGSRPSWVEEDLSQQLAVALVRSGERLDRFDWRGGWGAWRWGELHRGVLSHPLGGHPVLGSLFNVGPFEAPGSSYTVCVGHYAHTAPFWLRAIPSLRIVADLSLEDAAALRAILPGGQSGDPLTRHYQDMLPRWLAGETVAVGVLDSPGED